MRRFSPALSLGAALAAGCGCPTFDEMLVEVEPTEERDVDILRKRVERGVDQFAEWTAREGVCVERITVRDDVTTLTWDATIVEADGKYIPAARAIVVSSAATLPDRVVRHELCHALDDVEELSTARAELFPTDDVDREDVYGTPALRRREAFAEICEQDPNDLAVLRAAGEGCGADFLSARTHFLDEVVFPGFPEAVTVEVGAPIAPVEWRVVATFGQDARHLYAMTGDDDGLVYLVGTSHAGLFESPPVLRVIHQDPHNGAILRVRELAVPVDPFGWASLVPTDTGGHLVYVGAGDRTFALYDPDTGARVFAMDEDIGLTGAGAVVNGVYYIAAFSDDHGFRAWDLATGAEVDVPSAGLEAFVGRVPNRLVPVDGGLEAQIDGTWARLDGDTWTTWTTPYGADEGTVLPDGRRLFLAYTPVAATQPVTLDPETGAWTVHPICQDRGDFHPMARLVWAAGRSWFLYPRSEDGVERVRIAALDLE